MSVPREVIARIDGREVQVWNTAAAGKPSEARVRSSIEEAHAALARYDVLERVRMCIAEAGYDPRHATLRSDGSPQIAVDASGDFGAPELVAWRAVSMVMAAPGTAPCYLCWKAVTGAGESPHDDRRCLSRGTLVEDCGVSRD